MDPWNTFHICSIYSIFHMLHIYSKYLPYKIVNYIWNIYGAYVLPICSLYITYIFHKYISYICHIYSTYTHKHMCAIYVTHVSHDFIYVPYVLSSFRTLSAFIYVTIYVSYMYHIQGGRKVLHQKIFTGRAGCREQCEVGYPLPMSGNE